MFRLRKLLRICIECLLILVLLLFCIQITIPRVVNLNKYKEKIYTKLKETTDREISLGNIYFNIFHGLSLQVYNVIVKEEDGEEDFINIPSMGFRIKILPLLERKVELESIVLSSPTVFIKQYDERTFNFSTLLKSRETKPLDEKRSEALTTTLLKKIIVEGGQSFVTDKQKGGVIYIKDINLVVENVSLKGPIDVDMSFKIPSDTQPFFSPSCLVHLDGKVWDLPLDLNPYQINMDLMLDLKYFNPTLFENYYKQYIPVESLKGLLSFSGSLSGRFESAIESKGQLELFKVHFFYPDGYYRPANIRYGSFVYKLKADQRDIELKSFDLTLDNLKIKGEASLKNYRDYKEMEIEGRASAPTVPVAYSKMLTPTKIFLKFKSGRYISPFLEDLVDGNLRNATFNIRGKISDFRNKEHIDPDMIDGRAEADNVRIRIKEDSAPAVLTSGEWILKHRDIYFNSFTGYYGNSMFPHLAAKFTDIGIDTTFTMEARGLVEAEETIDLLTWKTFNALPFFGYFRGNGFIKTNIRFIIPVKHKQDFQITGTAEPINIRFSLRGGWLDFRQFSPTMIFTGEGLTITKSTFYLGSSPVTFSANSSNWFNPKVFFQLESDNFNFSNIFDEDMMRRFRSRPGKGTGSSTEKTDLIYSSSEDPILPWSINGDIRLATGKLGKLPFRKMKSKLGLKSGVLKLYPTTFESCDGKIELERFEIIVDRKNRGDFELSLKIDKMDIATYLVYSQVSEGIATGKIDIDALVNGNLKSSYNVRRSLCGIIKFDVRNGVFPRLKKYVPLFSYLQLKVPQKNLQGFPFTRTVGSFSINKGTMSFTEMVVESNIVKITVEGDVFLPTETMDLIVGVHFSEPIDVVFEMLPVVGTIVAGPDQQLLTTYFTVRGPTHDPNVGISAGYSWKQGAKKAYDTLTGN